MTISGRLDLVGTTELWQTACELIEHRRPRQLRLRAANIDYCDGTGIGLLVEMERLTVRYGGSFELEGLRDEFAKLREQFVLSDLAELPSSRPRPCCLPEATGMAVVKTWQALRALIAFTGELSIALLAALRCPRSVRWRDVWLIAEKAGADALPIVALLSFLVGLIMAFQAAIPMRQFGTEIYVANLIGLATLRELGPLMTAIILAGRSASAFAAEIGTMKVNEEIDALTTMGLAPVPFLVVTRVLAALFVTPLLTLFADLLGLAGGSVVLLSLNYPLVTYIHQVQSAVGMGDCLGGLAKSLVFGIIIAAIGCLHGLRTGRGASAVGDAATRAVVSGIVLIVIGDGIFSVLYYYLGI
ncbi:ABC transporter permease [Syntrophotalea acetylenivorans]|uniref:ABC transporter permease n=1 Tax=Syntrophotalea acetylenivorans TaxID=1842532 RepID=A0A1L3GQB8_9BACT|nr:ABC transporter permease [Syntrophotalea acetylenivorans]